MGLGQQVVLFKQQAMPPKQKEVKKGPTYKQAAQLKDIVPTDVKEPPREPKSLKIPQSFPQPPKNIEPLAPLFEDWPSQEAIKSHDFGVNSQSKFIDPHHESIVKFIERETKAQWRHLNDIEHQDESQQQQDEEDEEGYNQSKNQIESLRHISGQKTQEVKEGPICVIETFLRPERQEEMQARLKQEAQKAEKAAKEKKKAGKKQEPKEEGPLQVSDVRMSDIISKSYMTSSAKWIGSILQIIKQRNLNDVNNNEAIWKKIYPQQNGVPQITKSGKYWVKLLHMGKYIKIEVDDRIPVNESMRQLLPLSQKYNQKWTLIISKAIIKYLSKAGNDKTVGNGLVAYALTGMIAQSISVSHFKQWQHLQQLIDNEHYQKKDIVLSCFSDNQSRNFKKNTKIKFENLQQNEEGFEEGHAIQRQIDTKIMNGFAYCIGDYFDNGGFNMVFSQQKSQKQMLLKHQYNQLCKISISNKSRQQKLEYRRKKKQLKEKLGIQQKKRLELISKAPNHYHFLKLLANVNTNCQYGQKQILLAKKCVLNKLNQPPNYDIPIEKEEKDTKSIQSLSVSVIKYKQQNELFPNLHDFSSIPGVLQLLQRKEKGKWIKDEDFIEYFDSLQILYNPNIFANKKIESVQSKRPTNFSYDENKQILVVQKVHQDEQKQRKVKLLFGFSYQKSAKDIFNPYTIIQKFDFDSFRSTSSVVTLNSDISSKLIHLNNQNSVFKLFTMSRGNYNYWISSDSPFKLMSISDYLSEFQGYNKKNITFQYPPIEAKTYFPIAKFRLKQQNNENNTVLIKLINPKEQLINSLNYRLVAIPKAQESMTTQQIEGIISKNGEKLMLAYEYTRLTIDGDSQYCLVIQAQSEDSIPDGSLEVQFLSKESGLTIDLMEQVQPVKFMEKYSPNKYGLICKQRIFTNSDSNASITVKLAQFQEIQGGGGGAGKAAKKGGKQQPTSQLLQRPFTKEKVIILRILNGEKILYETTGVNQLTVPNIKFLSTKVNPSKQYYLLVKFDLRLWPQAALKSEETEKISWVAQVMSQQSLALVRDTRQQDREKQTRKSWEDAEPGRAQRAKKARRKFLIELKKQRGEALAQEQEQILNAPRLTKKQILEEQKKNEQNKKGAKGGKKDEKKAGKDAKKEQVIEQKAPERDPPKSSDNFMNQIKEFLGILENCIVKYQPIGQGQSRIRSEQQLKSIRQAAKMANENRVGKLIRNIQKRQTIKIKQKEKKQSVSIYLSEIKSQFKQKYSSYIQWRTQDNEKDKARQQKQRLLIDIINQQKPTISEGDLKKNISEYRDISGHNTYLADVADMVRKNIRISNLTDKINSLMVGWQIQQLKNINEEIKNDKIQGIDGDILKQFKQMLEEVERNPNIVAEKQAQAKKAKKGGKK